MRNTVNKRWLGAAGALVVCVVLFGAARNASATTATISLNSFSVNIGTSQVITLTINGSDTNVQGADLYAQVNDGGAGNPPGTSTKPTITGISMSQAGMMFAGDGALETFTQSNGPLIGYDSIASPTQLSDGPNKTFATITLNTSTMSSGNTFTIQFTNVGPSHNNSDLSDNTSSTTNITLTGNGFGTPATITVVPEPSSALALAMAATGLLLPRRRVLGR